MRTHVKFVYALAICIGLLTACGGNSDDDDGSYEPEEPRETKILSAVDMAAAKSHCESGIRFESRHWNDKRMQDFPAICQPGTTPAIMRLKVNVEDNLHPALAAFNEMSDQTYDLHLRSSGKRRHEELQITPTGRCAWSDYGGYGWYPYSSVDFEFSEILPENEIQGIAWAAGANLEATVNAGEHPSVVFLKRLYRSTKAFPMDCSKPTQMEAFLTPDWTDGLDMDNLPTMISITLTPKD